MEVVRCVPDPAIVRKNESLVVVKMRKNDLTGQSGQEAGGCAIGGALMVRIRWRWQCAVRRKRNGNREAASKRALINSMLTMPRVRTCRDEPKACPAHRGVFLSIASLSVLEDNALLVRESAIKLKNSTTNFYVRRRTGNVLSNVSKLRIVK